MSKEKILKEFEQRFSSRSTIDLNLFPDVKQFLSQAIKQTKKETREETIKEIEESLPKAQKITQKDWLGLDYTLGDVKYREHTYRLLVLDILNKLKK